MQVVNKPDPSFGAGGESVELSQVGSSNLKSFQQLKAIPGVGDFVGQMFTDPSATAESAGAMMQQAQAMWEEVTGLLKITVGFGQVISTVQTNFSVPWPNFLVMFYDSLSILNLDLIASLSFDCVSGSFNFYSNFSTTIVCPLVFLIALVAVTFFRSQGVSLERQKVVSDQCWKVALLFLFLVYPGVSSTILKLYRCRQIEEEWYAITNTPAVFSMPQWQLTDCRACQIV